MAGTNELLLPFVAEKVTGLLFEKGGMKMLLISNMDKVDEENIKQERKK